ncbi:MAG: hypothetical protein L6V93_00510 [Clostridiales bacterium]|nr:MAG: hypothetical protein L6V93_00510 [Clostridiales bacterium]
MEYNLKMICGNTQNFTVQNNDGDFEEGDKVTFSVKKNYSDDTYLLKKEVTVFAGNLADINIVPRDTANIEPGQYVYDIQFSSFDGKVKNNFQGRFYS